MLHCLNTCGTLSERPRWTLKKPSTWSHSPQCAECDHTKSRVMPWPWRERIAPQVSRKRDGRNELSWGEVACPTCATRHLFGPSGKNNGRSGSPFLSFVPVIPTQHFHAPRCEPPHALAHTSLPRPQATRTAQTHNKHTTHAAFTTQHCTHCHMLLQLLLPCQHCCPRSGRTQPATPAAKHSPPARSLRQLHIILPTVGQAARRLGEVRVCVCACVRVCVCVCACACVRARVAGVGGGPAMPSVVCTVHTACARPVAAFVCTASNSVCPPSISNGNGGKQARPRGGGNGGALRRSDCDTRELRLVVRP
jgi:hypothetical protein